jgi:hypothetical protein
MSKFLSIKGSIINFLLTFLFGIRIDGEPINLEYGIEAPKRTQYPPDQPDEFRWYDEFRVGSLHKVKQHVYLN